MSGHHHDDHHSIEQKPVSFTVPFFMATAFIIIMLLFLSLCDPKAHHEHSAEGHGHGAAAVEAGHHEAAAPAAAVENEDTVPVESTVPAAEPAHH